MIGLALLDLLLVAVVAALSWGMYYAAQPPPSDANIANRSRPPGSGASLPLAVGTPALDGSRLEAALRGAKEGRFDGLGDFLKGAKLAYEEIVNDFARGDISPHAQLLSEDVLGTFSQAIAQQRARGETTTILFIGFKSTEIVACGLDAGGAWIDVRFVSELVSATRNRAGEVVAGHSRRVNSISEVWTFERPLVSASPDWIVTATSAAE